MSNNQRWHPQDQQHYYPQQPPQNIRHNPQHNTAAAVHNAQALLAVYPMASANPTNHAVRHLSSIYTTAAPPTFVQPSYYTPRTAYPQGNPPPYTEYDQQVRYLSAPQPPSNDGYWTAARDSAVRMLADQQPATYRYPAQQTWRPPHGSTSSFQTSPFAQSVFQRTAPPSMVYPTPSPPVMSSSSSLAYALGPPPAPLPQSILPPPKPQKVYRPEESRDFFNSFLEQKAREMNPHSAAQIPSSSPAKTPASKFIADNKPRIPDSSPDPLSALLHSSPVPVTPRKRKPIVEIDSPSVKRMQFMRKEYKSVDQLIQSPASSVPTTPSSKSSSSYTSNATPTPRRPVNKAYVDVPSSPWSTPYTSRNNSYRTPAMSARKFDKSKMETPDDLGGYGIEDEDDSPLKRRGLTDSIRSSARRTGERDDRAPLEKFLCLVEDIFEAEDSLPSDFTVSDLPEFFSSLSINSSHPYLHSTQIRKLTKYIGQVARPNQRLRSAAPGVMGTPRAQGRMAEVDTQFLSRLLKILERTVKTGEDIDPFRYIAPTPSVKGSPRKKATKTKKVEDDDTLPTLATNGKGAEVEDLQESETQLTNLDHEKLSHALDVGRESILAADCCIALLASDRLTKQLYSEELITSCLSTVKNQLTKVIYPFVEASSGSVFDLQGNPMLRFVTKDFSSTALDHRKRLGELFQALSGVLPRINNLVNAESVAMSDTIIIQAVYIAIGPFFVVEGSGDGETKGKKEKENAILKTLGKSAMRGLRLDALALIRSIFANHESQRSWIIEEILTSLIKLSDTKAKTGQFRLRDGRSIRTVSALLLQLVQTSAHDIRLKSRKIEKNRQNQLALRRQESFSESQPGPVEPFLDENDHEEIVLYKGGLDSAMIAAKTIIGFLTKRSGKGKATKNSNEAEYRAIFDNLIGDLLVVLFWPEWPAAGVLLNMICRYMISALDEKNANSQIDSNAAKTIALDHLGIIAAKIRTATLKYQRPKASEDLKSKARPLESMEEIVSNQDIKTLERLLKAHRDVTTHLAKRSSEDQAFDSARELSAAVLGQELAGALQQLHKWIEMPDMDEDLNLKDSEKLRLFGNKVRSALRDIWKEPTTDVFDVGSQDEMDRIDQLAEEIGTLQGLRSSFNPILTTIVSSLNAPAIFMRTKALRALGQIVTSDPTVLSMPVVRRGIESHLLDSSPAVRDAAVELIGKYIIDSPEVAGDYYQKIAERMADTGLSVRKRVIKLLKSFYFITQEDSRKIDIATRMVLRMMDEDDSVKELAAKTVEELWFPNTNSVPTTTRARSTNSNQVTDKSTLLEKVTVIMGTAAHFKDRQSPLEDLLHKIIAEKSESEVSALHKRYSQICEALIDGLVDATDLPGFTVINCIRTIYLFTSSYPHVLSGANASTLLPYLKNASTPEELSTTDYLLKIFRVSIPHMPKTAGKFGQELQLALQPMIIKPSGNGGVQILQEAVSCMCIVVQHLTHDFVRLVNLLKSCNGRLQQALKKPTSHQMEASEVRPLLILIFIVALLGEHCNFDQLRIENTALAKDLDTISKGSIMEHIYMSLLQLYEKYDQSVLRGRILQCLGFLFRAQPTLMTKDRSATIMDAIFASSEEENKGRLLRIMQDFLVSESEKHAVLMKEMTKSKPNKPTSVNMDELVGNTDGFADSGVSSAIVQRYLNQVLEAALSPHSQNQAAAVDVLSFTIKQGLAHPLQSFPVIIALETSPQQSLSSRASALHAILQGKHASLLNTRYIISARASFDYQKKVATDVFKGYRMDGLPVALLQRWYSLVREKRPSRQEFLKALVKVFQENPDQQSTQDDVDFTRYMAENFATFDYKTQEEVITVIKYLTVVLSTTGMQLLETVSPSHLLRQLHAPLEPVAAAAEPVEPNGMVIANEMEVDSEEKPTLQLEPVSNEVVTDADTLDKLPLMRTTVIIGMVMLLKSYLQSLYLLSDEKCNKFVIGKKSVVGDKPTTRKHQSPITWERLPYATKPVLTTEDIQIQKSKFLEIWNEDGVTAEQEDDLDCA